ncbi:hypothetical protein ABPG72_015449 [Tetrahymena utriculariae]
MGNVYGIWAIDHIKKDIIPQQLWCVWLLWQTADKKNKKNKKNINLRNLKMEQQLSFPQHNNYHFHNITIIISITYYFYQSILTTTLARLLGQGQLTLPNRRDQNIVNLSMVSSTPQLRKITQEKLPPKSHNLLEQWFICFSSFIKLFCQFLSCFRIFNSQQIINRFQTSEKFIEEIEHKQPPDNCNKKQCPTQHLKTELYSQSGEKIRKKFNTQSKT